MLKSVKEPYHLCCVCKCVLVVTCKDQNKKKKVNSKDQIKRIFHSKSHGQSAYNLTHFEILFFSIFLSLEHSTAYLRATADEFKHLAFLKLLHVQYEAIFIQQLLPHPNRMTKKKNIHIYFTLCYCSGKKFHIKEKKAKRLMSQMMDEVENFLKLNCTMK